MIAAPRLRNEEERLAALREYEILDTADEAGFDDIAKIAAHICGAPIALVSLVDEDRQCCKARVGIDPVETPRHVAFCAHAILGPETLVVADATADERFADNPLVTEDPRIRFYAGAPLVTPLGHALGTLCAIDRRPRSLEPGAQLALEALARQIVVLLEHRRVSARLARSLERIKLLSGTASMCGRMATTGRAWRSSCGITRTPTSRTGSARSASTSTTPTSPTACGSRWV